MIDLTQIQAITFDLDDTLWPIAPTIAHADQALAAWLAVHAPQTAVLSANLDVRREIRTLIEVRHPERSHDLSFLRLEAIRESLRRAGEPEHLAEAAFETFFAARNQVFLFDGVEQAMSRLAARYPLVAVSNGNADVFRTPVGAYFQASVSARDCGVAKPDPRIFEAAAQRLALPPHAVLHVGDDVLADAVGARGVGMQAVWVNTHARDWSHDSAQPLTVSQVTQLCDYLLA
jgi:HAD superfamily hydrolase (TIGR01549 family)